MKLFHNLLILSLSCLLLANPTFSGGLPVGTLSEGAPARLGQNLGTQNYIAVRAFRLVKARLIWLNFDYLREVGIDVPAVGLTSQFEREVLDAFAYGIPGEGESDEDYLHEEKTFYADRYGGAGLGYNFGSGRAAIAGQVQIKGIGRTPLVSEEQGDSHSNGTAPAHEGIREAVYGELNQQLPYRGNRVVAVIDRGTFTELKDGKRQRDFLIVRVDPLRPAHFAEAWCARGALKATELDRIHQASQFFVQSLPIPVLPEGLSEYVRRLAAQYAAGRARKIYHGATSLSNVSLDGGWLDYGTETTQPGYAKIQVIKNVEPAGELTEIKKDLIQDFVTDSAKNFPAEITAKIPNVFTLINQFESDYENYLRREFLLLTGVPPSIVQYLESTPRGAQLGQVLHKIAIDGVEVVEGRYNVPNQVGTYDLKDILVRLADARTTDPTALQEAIRPSMPKAIDSLFRKRLAEEYGILMAEVMAQGNRDGITTRNLQTYVAENARVRNTSAPLAYRWNMMKEDFALIDAYNENGNPLPIREAIERRIQESVRDFAAESPYELTIKEITNRADGSVIRYVYDAKTNTYALRLRAIAAHSIGQKVRIFGQETEVPTFTDVRRGKPITSTQAVIPSKLEWKVNVGANDQAIRINMTPTDSKVIQFRDHAPIPTAESMAKTKSFWSSCWKFVFQTE
jgi:hypothetical protein